MDRFLFYRCPFVIYLFYLNSSPRSQVSTLRQMALFAFYAHRDAEWQLTIRSSNKNDLFTEKNDSFKQFKQTQIIEKNL